VATVVTSPYTLIGDLGPDFPVAPGLFDVVKPRDFPDRHMAGGGVQYVPDSCGTFHLYPALCPSGNPAKTFDAVDGTVTGQAFIVYSTLRCGSLSFRNGEWEQRVTRRLEISEQRGVERGLWGAAAGDVISWLQTPANGVVTLAATTSIVAAMSTLEANLDACYGLPGIIHATPATAPYLMANTQLLPQPNGLFKTATGNWVVFGRGYSGLGPTGQAIPANGAWLYATGMPRIWRAPDIVIPPAEQVLDRITNQQSMLAEREYVLAIDCCAFAVSTTF
jgi:hypothetical protein